jgi:hypothetical protein
MRRDWLHCRTTDNRKPAYNMNLTETNYYSAEANAAYLSNSQYKSWLDCPARTAAEARGEWVEDERDALLVGNYVDTALLTPDLMEQFLSKNSDAIFTKRDKALRAPFVLADTMVARCKRDALFMGALDGDHQVIATWEMYGVMWRAKFDSVDPSRGVLTDLKTVKSFDSEWSAEHKMKLPFYEVWHYWRQMAIYREGYKALYGKYPEVCTIAAVSKQAHPRLKVLVMDNDEAFARELEKVEANLPTIIAHREMLAHNLPVFQRCGRCDYCAETGECDIEHAEKLVW